MLKYATILLLLLYSYLASAGQGVVRRLGDTTVNMLEIAASDSAEIKLKDLLLKLKSEKVDSLRIFLLERVGNAYRDRKMIDSSIAYFKQALELNKKIGYSLQRQTWEMGTLDFLLWETGNYTEALAWLDEEMAISRTIKDTLHLGFAHLTRGHVYSSLEEHWMALDEYARSLDLFKAYYRRAGSPLDVANIELNMGREYLEVGNTDSALFHAALGKAYAAVEKDKYAVTLVDRLYADVYKVRGNMDSAFWYYRKYLLDAETLGLWNRELGMVYNSMAQIFQMEGQRDSAYLYASLGLRNALRFDDKEDVYRSALALSDHFSEQNPSEAYRFLKMANQARDGMLGFEKLRQAQILEFNQQVRDKELAEVERKDMARRRFGFIFVGSLFLIAAFLLWYYLRELSLKYRAILKQKEEENLRTTYGKQIVELEARALRAQMNPHFIFNCMNSIKGLIQHKEEEKAVSYLTTFSSLLRGLLQSSDHGDITLHDELEICRLYVKLEAMRFGEKLRYSFSIDEGIDLKSVTIPAMIIQPFIENAIWHGILPKSGGGELAVSVSRSADEIRCVVDDDGIGREVARKNAFRMQGEGHRSKGLSLVRSRLDLDGALNQRNADLDIVDKKGPDGEAAGTRIILTFKDY